MILAHGNSFNPKARVRRSFSRNSSRLIAFAPNILVATIGAALFGASQGTFLAVDWALMTDIIPKAESGRYMGISNIAVASAGPIASTVGGVLVFTITQLTLGSELAYRAIFVLMSLELVVGAWALRHVTEPARDRSPAPRPEAASAT